MKDNLNIAFKELRKLGIVARQNFMCCQSCGWANISKDEPKKTIGYAFYHAQDAERLKEDGKVNIAYDTANEKKFTQEQIGIKVALALANNGLKVNWSGEKGMRIEVVGLVNNA